MRRPHASPKYCGRQTSGSVRRTRYKHSAVCCRGLPGGAGCTDLRPAHRRRQRVHVHHPAAGRRLHKGYEAGLMPGFAGVRAEDAINVQRRAVPFHLLPGACLAAGFTSIPKSGTTNLRHQLWPLPLPNPPMRRDTSATVGQEKTDLRIVHLFGLCVLRTVALAQHGEIGRSPHFDEALTCSSQILRDRH